MKVWNKDILTAMAVAVVVIGAAGAAHAGTGGTPFDDVWLTMTDWIQGTLGRIIAGSMVAVGMVGGIARQSLMSVGLGIGGGMALYNTPKIIDSVLTATLPTTAPLVEAAASVGVDVAIDPTIVWVSAVAMAMAVGGGVWAWKRRRPFTRVKTIVRWNVRLPATAANANHDIGAARLVA